MKDNKWFGVRRYLLPIWVAACMIASLPISAQADTTYDFANLGAASGGFKPQGNRFLVSDQFENDTFFNTTIYYTDRSPSISGIIIKPDGINLASFDLNDLEFKINPGPVEIASMLVTATRSSGELVSVNLVPGLFLNTGDTFNLSGKGIDLSAFTNVTQLQFDVTMTGQDAKIMSLDFASITISNEVLPPPTISNSFGSASIPLNGSTSLTFSINNANTSSSLSGIAFNNYLPAGLVVAPVPGLNNSCGGTATAVAGSSLVSLSGATLAPSTSCSISVNVQGTTPGVKNNSVTIISANGGTGNTSTASLEVEAADLALVNTTPMTAIPLNNLTFNISVTNSGPSTAQTVSIIDALPANTTFKSVSMGGASGWEVTTPAVGGSGTVTCTKSSVAVGESAIFQVTVRISEDAPNNSTISNTAIVSALTLDPDPSNNASSTTSTVSYPVRVELPGASYSPTLSKACADASSPNTIKVWGIEFAQSLNLNQNKILTLKGGYDSGFLNNAATTTIVSPLIVSNGALTLERIVIK